MTNNINGIDVSECKKLGETIDGFTCGLGKRIRFANEIITKHNLCKDNSDCYFKQLKRLQEENEELKNKNNDLIEEIASKNIDIAISQKEYEELKKYIGGFTFNCRYCDEWYMDKCNYIKKDNKYKQALEEIRKIILKNDPECDCNISNIIIKKINEVLNE
jgi:5-formaminoimidazole-4-carboxamide-1-beta-D-ribofuranosyl 5'-monophosphate synthetase